MCSTCPMQFTGFLYDCLNKEVLQLCSILSLFFFLNHKHTVNCTHWHMLSLWFIASGLHFVKKLFQNQPSYWLYRFLIRFYFFIFSTEWALSWATHEAEKCEEIDPKAEAKLAIVLRSERRRYTRSGGYALSTHAIFTDTLDVFTANRAAEKRQF